MDLQTLKNRVAGTGYFPDWLKEAVAGLSPATASAPDSATQARWCPFVRNTSRLGIASLINGWNRVITTKTNADGSAGIVTLNTKAAPCVKSQCQMWTGTDCGLKFFNNEMVAFMKKAQKEQSDQMKNFKSYDDPNDPNDPHDEPAATTE